MSSITSLPVCTALPPRAGLAPDCTSALQPGLAGAVGAAADSDPTIPIRDQFERMKLRANLTVELVRALYSVPYSLSQQSIDGLRTLGIPIDALLAENGNVWDQAGIRQLESLLNPAPPPPPPYWQTNPAPSPYPYPVDPSAPMGDSPRSKLNRPYV